MTLFGIHYSPVTVLSEISRIMAHSPKLTAKAAITVEMTWGETAAAQRQGKKTT